MMTAFPAGVWPAMITPLHDDYSIDWDGVDALTDWYIEAGVAGLFAVGQSSEMFYLSNDERLKLARRVVERAAGRVPVLASGTFDRDPAFLRQMADTGVTGVTVLASIMADADEADDILRQRLESLLEAVPDVPLALYECPQPYHRLLSPDVLRWAGETGRFFLVKGTSRDFDAVKSKIDAVLGTPLRFYNADATTLLDSLRYGAVGYCGIAANFYPDVVVWLCQNVEHLAAGAIQAAVTMADPVIHHRYPVCAKYYRGNMPTISRVTDVTLDSYDRRALDAIKQIMAGVLP